MKVVLISAGLLAPKKADSVIHRRHRYLNYGLLSLANSHNISNGHLFHGNFDSPDITWGNIESLLAGRGDVLFMISTPSFLSLPWAREFVGVASNRCPSAKFWLGGRWVTNGNVDFLRSYIPRLDYIFENQGEYGADHFARREMGVNIERTERARRIFDEYGLSYLDYSKLHDTFGFVPSFEASRGCGAGCNYCAEANVRLTKLKPARVLCEEIQAYLELPGSPVKRFYLEASNFVPRLDWIGAFASERHAFSLHDVLWRTEARVDMFSARAIDALAQCGLRVLDLGLESASSVQLLRMNKTKDPAAYLQRCSQVVKAASQAGILVKVNILLYPGENFDSLSRTADWLHSHRDWIAGISAYPTVYYGLHPNSDPLVSYYKSCGASIANESQAPGIYNLHLSEELSHSAALEEARKISRQIMSGKMYFTLKSFSYFDPNYTENQFWADVERTDKSILPFEH